MNPSNVNCLRPRSPARTPRVSVDLGTAHEDSDDEVRVLASSSINTNSSYLRIEVADHDSGSGASPSPVFSCGPQQPWSVAGAGMVLPPDVDCAYEQKLRLKLAFFFMDPVKKFIARRQAPWKLIVQFLKILLVTPQLIFFGTYRYAHTNYYTDNTIGFQNLFLKDWDSVREINAYPPSTGAYALYRQATFYSYFNHTAHTFYRLDQVVVNPIFRNSTLDFCVEAFSEFRLDTMEMYQPVVRCLNIPHQALEHFNSKAYLEQHGLPVPWDRLQRMFINFTLTTVTFRQMGPVLGPACFSFGIVILFDNSDHDGQITISLTSSPRRISCPGARFVTTWTTIALRMLDLTVILNCLLSFVLCFRALFRAQALCAETRRFFKTAKQSDLSPSELFQFLNLWYIVICVNDILIIVGSVLKELIEVRETSGDLWNFCSVFLGTGSLLVWIGMLRYLGFFDTYNVLILTLKGALPNVVRFMICAGILYLGYTFCGWVVLGPYHFKFKTLETTSECLFSLINGDDMFATFSMISDKARMIHGFSRLYLYSFVMLFIYVILSLFIAIIMDTYEVIKEYYKMGFPRSRIDQFYMSQPFDCYSDLFFDGHAPSMLYRIWAAAMIRLYGNQWKGYQREQKPAGAVPPVYSNAHMNDLGDSGFTGASSLVC